MRGYSLVTSPDLAPWEQRTAVSLARAIAALQRAPAARCLTHTSAALVLGLGMWAQEPDVHLATACRPRRTATRLPAVHYPRTGPPTPAPGGPRAGAKVVHLRRRRLDLPGEDIIEVAGLPVTTALRTAFDCACDEPAHNALCIADSALRLVCDPCTWRPGQCEAPLAQARAAWQRMIEAGAGRHGIRQARAVLAAASPWSDSPAESLVRWLVLALGLPAPELQHPVETRRGTRYLDLSWPDLRIVLEADGRMKYQAPQDIYDEKLRQDDIHAQGWTMLRIPTEDLRDLRALAGRILALFPAPVLAGLRPDPLLRGAGLWGSRSEGPVLL